MKSEFLGNIGTRDDAKSRRTPFIPQFKHFVKKDGRRIEFDATKLRSSMQLALRKRPVSTEQVDGLVAAAGKVKQIVYGSYGTQTNSSTNTYVDTGLTATITPTSATSKILVMIAHGANQKETNNTSMAMRLYRGATSIAQIMVDGGKDGTTGRLDFGGTSINVLDEPATTSATTYKTQFMSQGGNAQVWVQTGGSRSTIILMEVKP